MCHWRGINGIGLQEKILKNELDAHGTMKRRACWETSNRRERESRAPRVGGNLSKRNRLGHERKKPEVERGSPRSPGLNQGGLSKKKAIYENKVKKRVCRSHPERGGAMNNQDNRVQGLFAAREGSVPVFLYQDLLRAHIGASHWGGRSREHFLVAACTRHVWGTAVVKLRRVGDRKAKGK